MQPRGTQLTCPNCRQPFSAQLEQVIDVGRDPQAKARLLAGRTNLVTCPHCGYQSMLATPLVYHDPAKELMLVYIPMELNLPRAEQDKLVGSLSNAIISSLPQEQRKGYLLMPKNMLSLQGMVEMILEADGVTKEMLEAQRAKMRLVETFLQADPDTLPELVTQYDAQIDQEFFAIMAATMDSALAAGRRDLAEQLNAVQERLAELSTTGQELLKRASAQEAAIQQVSAALNGLGEKASYDDFVDLTFQIANEGGDELLQVLVGLARPQLDYQFFQTLTARIDQAEGDDKDTMIAIRDRLLELTKLVDQQQNQVLREAADTLKAIANSPDLDTAIRERIWLLDDTFLAVLSANIQAAEEAKEAEAVTRLKEIFERVVTILRQNAPPAIQFINDVMQMKNLDEARAAIASRAAEFGPELVQWIDMLGQDLSQRGNSPALERLITLREEAVKAVGEGGDAPAMQSAPRTQVRQPAADPNASNAVPGRPQLIIPPSRKSSRRE